MRAASGGGFLCDGEIRAHRFTHVAIEQYPCAGRSCGRRLGVGADGGNS